EAYGSLDALIRDANEQLIAKRAELDECYQKAKQLYAESASEESFRELLNHVNGIKASIRALEAKCHDMAVADSKKEEEWYGSSDHEETTLSNLVMEYGALDHLFIVPPEMASLKLNMHSNVPIPRELWSDDI